MKQVHLKIEKVCHCVCTVYYNGKAKVMIIDDVFVDPAYRGLGYGQKLMDMAINLAKKEEIDSIELNVNRDNEVAISLYKKNGFEVTYKDYYRLILNKWTL